MPDVPEAQEFEGTYVAHWENARFVMVTGRNFLGRPTFENWCMRLPPSFEFPDTPRMDRGPAHYYAMRVTGRLGPKGRFGHKGLCRRELDVIDVLKCEPRDDARSGRARMTFTDAD